MRLTSHLATTCPTNERLQPVPQNERHSESLISFLGGKPVETNLNCVAFQLGLLSLVGYLSKYLFLANTGWPLHLADSSFSCVYQHLDPRGESQLLHCWNALVFPQFTIHMLIAGHVHFKTWRMLDETVVNEALVKQITQVLVVVVVVGFSGFGLKALETGVHAWTQVFIIYYQ